MGKRLSFILVLLFAGVLLTGCSRGNNTAAQDEGTDQQNTEDTAQTDEQEQAQQSAQSTGSGLPSPSADLRARAIKENQTATQFIQQLQPDAQMILVSMKFINSFSDISGLSTNYYIFRSPVDARYYFLVDVPRNGDQSRRFLMPREDFEFQLDLLPLPFADWKLTYADAIQKAEESGGADFRSRHSNFEASVILGLPAGQNRLAWNVTYRATDGSSEELKIWVDAANGTAEVIK